MKYILFSILLIFSVTVKAQLPDSLTSHLDSALLILKGKSLYYKNVNWDQVRTETYAKAATAKNKKETFDALAYAFGQLNDKHGVFMQEGQSFRLQDSAMPNRLSDSLKAEWAKGWKITCRMIGNVAYFRMPNVAAFNKTQIDAYANRLYDSIALLAAKKPESWIIDLRRNAGGNIRPMMAAVAPFFEDGIVAHQLDRDNKVIGHSAFKNGDFISDDTLVEANVINKIRSFPSIKVAVLIGVGTGSSGEGVAAAFKERKRTKLFGEPTAGFANSTEGFLFNSNNSYFLLTTSQLAGKDRKPLGDTIHPDVAIKNNDHFNDLLNDNAIKAALKWLKPKK